METEADGAERESIVDARRAAREAATAAAVGAAVGAMRALSARTNGGEEGAELTRDEEPDVARDRAEGPAPADEAAAAPDGEPRTHERREAQPPRAGAEPGRARELVDRAREQLRELHGSEAEAVSSFERTPDGWAVTLEVVELRRIPESTDVLASYRVELDGDGNLLRYERVRRYHRSEASDGRRS